MSMKKWWLAGLAVFIAWGTARADIVVDKDGKVQQGTILKVDGDALILSSTQQKLYALKDLRGFCREDEEVYLTLSSGEKFTGRFEGADSESVIIRGPQGLKSYKGSEINTLVSYHSRLFADTEAGLFNGVMLMGYNPLKNKVAEISTSSNLPALGYVTGAYLESRYFLNPGLGLKIGAAFFYLPTQSTRLMNSGGAAYGDLYADTLKVEVRGGVFLALNSKLDIGLTLAPAVNVTSVYQTTSTNSTGTYITHTTFGLKPSLEIRYRLLNRLVIGLSAGYELMSTPDGVYVGLTTGLRY